MAQLDPTATTVGDICTAALRECGALGIGQSALAIDLNDAWARLQWMLQQWERKRWLVYHLVDLSKISTGQQIYTVGPGGDLDSGSGVPELALGSSGILTINSPTVTGLAPLDWLQLRSGDAISGTGIPAGTTVLTLPVAGILTISNLATQSGQSDLVFLRTAVPSVSSVRPARIESSFLRQLNIPGSPLWNQFNWNEAPWAGQSPGQNQIDYPLRVLQSREDYNRIALKSLVSFPGVVFLDSDWPLGKLHVWPVPNANIYEIHISVLAQLPFRFATINTIFSIPYEYYAAILYNLAIRLRPKYRLPSFPGDPLPGLAKDSLNVLRGANVQIGSLVMPGELMNTSQYNIFSDRSY